MYEQSPDFVTTGRWPHVRVIMGAPVHVENDDGCQNRRLVFVNHVCMPVRSGSHAPAG